MIDETPDDDKEPDWTWDGEEWSYVIVTTFDGLLAPRTGAVIYPRE